MVPFPAEIGNGCFKLSGETPTIRTVGVRGGHTETHGVDYRPGVECLRLLHQVKLSRVVRVLGRKGSI